MQKSHCSYLHAAKYDNGISNFSDFIPSTSRLQANKAAGAVSKDWHIKSPVLAELSLNSCIFKSAAGFRDYKKHI